MRLLLPQRRLVPQTMALGEGRGVSLELELPQRPPLHRRLCVTRVECGGVAAPEGARPVPAEDVEVTATAYVSENVKMRRQRPRDEAAGEGAGQGEAWVRD